MTPVTFKLTPTSQRGQTLLQWQDEGNDKLTGLHSLQMPLGVGEYILHLQGEVTRLRAADGPGRAFATRPAGWVGPR